MEIDYYTWELEFWYVDVRINAHKRMQIDIGKYLELILSAKTSAEGFNLYGN